jgi:hypothetical protein
MDKIAVCSLLTQKVRYLPQMKYSLKINLADLDVLFYVA